MKQSTWKQGVAVASLAVWVGAAGAAGPLTPFQRAAQEAYAAAQAGNEFAVRGVDGWYFLPAELRFLAQPQVGGASIRASGPVPASGLADPLPAIVAFHRALKARGIELVLLPVPAKAAVYPEKLVKDFAPALQDQALQPFYAALRKEGVEVLDLGEDFFRAAHEEGLAMYCRTDTHWSPAACRRAAAALASRWRDAPWAAARPKTAYDRRETQIEFTGDLVAGVADAVAEKETLPATLVGRSVGGVLERIPSDESSPLLLMGDSHTLVFNDGQLLASRCGLADYLAGEMGFPLDLSFRSRAGGSSQVRLDLYRRQLASRREGGDYLAGKKAVIWCFTAREFTESAAGWRIVPLEK